MRDRRFSNQDNSISRVTNSTILKRVTVQTLNNNCTLLLTNTGSLSKAVSLISNQPIRKYNKSFTITSSLNTTSTPNFVSYLSTLSSLSKNLLNVFYLYLLLYLYLHLYYIIFIFAFIS